MVTCFHIELQLKELALLKSKNSSGKKSQCLHYLIYIDKKEDRKITQSHFCISSMKIQKFHNCILSRGKKNHAIFIPINSVFVILQLPYQYYAPLYNSPLTFTFFKSIYPLKIISFHQDLKIQSLHHSTMYPLICHDLGLPGLLSILFSMLEVTQAYGELML